MRWQGNRRSDNVEDRRGMPPRNVMVGGGLGTLLLIIVIALLGGDPTQLLQQLPQNQPGAAGAPNAGAQAPPEQEELTEFVSVILADTEDVWTDLFQEMGRTYEKPKLTLFTGSVDTDCGFASAATGPFYCPADRKVFIDLSFYDELARRFKAPGDFAQAYVLAHEVGHHVQNLLGVSERVQRMRGRVSEAEYNQLSVRLELQADFYAGVWAHHAQKQRQLLEQGDIEEGLRAASAIGDDRLQREAQGYVVPDSFTHGTSEQRVNWFLRGLKSGDVEQGDTFNARSL